MHTPTRSPASKLSFTIHCPMNDEVPVEGNCAASIKRKLHICFAVCITKKSVRENYDPVIDCMNINDPEQLDPCIGEEI
ncbi:unnamed protein product [Dracunculus medinensis]|uniref:Uncharacterized protein n=1 Tax=Dracunculus medinensis TaxID=318479 RepID=A0A0N4URI0_DRAME|nr:unnamed protein product [Dracunculus medinensis]